jgi:L-ascorbate metabolism protein UlaG (beta-lactamase superfamily)
VGVPKYTPAAARSSARRYPKHLIGAFAQSRDADTRTLDPESLESLAGAPLGATWLGHATVLLRVDGRWVLTDPVFSHRIGVKVGPMTFGVSRHTPAIDPRTLPRPDLILISHAHFDHLDRPSLRALANRATRVITARHTKGLVPRGFGDVREVDWEHDAEVEGLRVAALRPNHWGARTIWDKHRGYNSYVLEHAGTPMGRPRRVLYAGDTAKSEAFRNVGPVDLSIFGIGAYDPWIHAHASPEEVWEMHQHAAGEHLLPIHHSTFELSDEPMDEPLRRLLTIAADQQHRVVGRSLGEVWRHEP